MRPHEIVPKLLEHVSPIAKLWLKQNGGDWLTVIPDYPRAPLMRLERGGIIDKYIIERNDYIPWYFIGNTLKYGPKLIFPSVAQCDLMSSGKLSFPWKDYAQPFTSTIVYFPEIWSEKNMVNGKKLDMIFIGSFREASSIMFLISQDNTQFYSSGVIFSDRGPEENMEDSFKFTLDYGEKKGMRDPAIEKALRLSININMLATNYGTKISHPNEAHWRKLVAKAPKSERAADELKMVPEYHTIQQFLNWKPPAIGEHDSEHGTHASPRPHFRSGHWRMQPHGKGSLLRKHKFIEWTLVNASKFDGDMAETKYEKSVQE